MLQETEVQTKGSAYDVLEWAKLRVTYENQTRGKEKDTKTIGLAHCDNNLDYFHNLQCRHLK